MTIETDEQFIQRLTSRNYELTVENDDMRTKLDEVQAECNARGIILNHNLKQWQSMFPDEIGNSWYYPGDKVKRKIDRLEHEVFILRRHISDEFHAQLMNMLFILCECADKNKPASPKHYTREMMEMIEYRGLAETRGDADNIVWVPTATGRQLAEALGYKSR